MTPAVSRVGIVGAGTMGSGIAQIAILGGFETQLYELDSKQLARGTERLRTGLRRGAERGDWSEEEAKDALARLRTETLIDPLAGCELVIEAVPEELELKRDVFARLAAVCGPEAVLATNTSSLSVTAIAAGAPEPGRVVGMHFFNPPARMRLVEIVAGEDSAPQPLVIATEAAERMGRTPIRTRDSIGFVANRCARPFTLEGLRIAGEGAATFGEVDRICRLAGGFRMGPFELMDLIGVDVNFGVARSFFKQSFEEPRWRPHPIQAQMVASGRLGRKSGRGFYVYEQDRPHRGRDPDVDAERPLTDDGEIASLAGDAAPDVLGRIAAQIVNEACFALEEGVASVEDIDTAMTLGFNWPLGPLAWGERLGWSRVLGTLEALRDLRGEAYRPSPLLRAAAAAGGLP